VFLGLSGYRFMAAAGLLWSVLLIALLLYGLAGVAIPVHLPTAALGAIALVVGLAVAWPRAPDSVSIGGAVIGVLITVWAAWAAAVSTGDITLPILLTGAGGGVAVIFSVAAAHRTRRDSSHERNREIGSQ
jgi:4-hydroxybenzoate polyprenyltransferase